MWPVTLIDPRASPIPGARSRRERAVDASRAAPRWAPPKDLRGGGQHRPHTHGDEEADVHDVILAGSNDRVDLPAVRRERSGWRGGGAPDGIFWRGQGGPLPIERMTSKPRLGKPRTRPKNSAGGGPERQG